jgi:hypothetical protein
MKIKNISVWFNKDGVDECLIKGKGEFCREVLNEMCEKVKWVGGWNDEMWNGLYEEVKGEGWVMFGYDGFGVFVVDEGLSVGKCKEEYDELLKVG